MCYLDDIFIYSKSSEEHKKTYNVGLQKLQEPRLYAKLEKCLFHQPRVEFF